MNITETKDNKLSNFLFIASISSIIAILLLRFYAIFFTVHVVGFDDKGYKRLSINNFKSTTLTGAMKDVIFPYNEPVYGRISNYTSWLALGAKFCNSCDIDVMFHLTNFLLFLIQGALIYLFSYYVTRQNPFSAFMTFLYLSSSGCFGMNKFLMTENLVMTSTLILSYFSLLLVAKKNTHSLIGEAAAAVLTAFMIGVFSLPREYAVLGTLTFSAGVFMTLLIQKRYVALAVFAMAIAPYLLRLDNAIAALFGGRDKFYCDLYYNPMHKWTMHVIMNITGPAFFIFLIFIIACSVYFFSRSVINLKYKIALNWLKEDKAALLLFAQIGLTLLYIAGVFITTTRVARIALLPMVTIVCLSLFLVYEMPALRNVLLSKRFKTACFFLIAISWTVMYYQLFIAFDSGKTYALPAFDMECYNHPLHLRPLVGENDMHVCGVENFPPCHPR